MGTVFLGLKKIATLLGRCREYEKYYLDPNPKCTNHDRLTEAIVELYACVLEFLAKSKRFLEQSCTGAWRASPFE